MQTSTPSATDPRPEPALVPEALARLVAAATLVTGVAAWLLAMPWLLLAILPDFLLRACDRRQWSYVAWLLRPVLARLPPAAQARRAYWAPKRFAAMLGTGFLVAILAAHLAGLPAWSRALLLMLTACAGLEAVLGVCVGCLMHAQLCRLGLASDPCPDGGCVAPAAPAAAE